MKRVFTSIFALAMVFGFSVSGHTTLLDRGGGLIYDDDLNITWLQDANLAATNTFGVGGITWDGQMSWYTANEWIAAMNAHNYLGYNDWRLPTTPGTSYGYVSEGEMGHLHYIELGGVINNSPFVNMQSFTYWTGTESDVPTPGHAWDFSFDIGAQHEHNKICVFFVWPVRDGDVGGAVTLGPGEFWIGLKNSDDQGTQFDLRAELYVNDVPASEGETLCITGVTRNPTYAKEVTVPFDPIPDGTYIPGDVLSLRVLTRIGTNPDGSKCPGHSNAAGLRLYYDSPSRTSGFGIQISPEPMGDYFLHSSSGDYFLNNVFPTGTVKYKDSGGINFNNGNPWKEIGTWSMTLP